MTHDAQPTLSKSPWNHVKLWDGLPAGTEIQSIEFPRDAAEGDTVLLRFPGPNPRVAVIAPPVNNTAPVVARERFTLLWIPVEFSEDSNLIGKVREWIDGPEPPIPPESRLLTLQGAKIVWAPGRAAVIVPRERVSYVRPAVIEFAFYDAELRMIEREIADGWPALETDSPMAFDFNEKSLRRRSELGQRFQRVVSLRARLSQILPMIHRPPIHPPTLASQIGDRLRERGRLVERLDFASSQLEVFERVYELCGQRASDFSQAHKGHVLEMIIIVLLLGQTLLLLVEMLAARGT